MDTKEIVHCALQMEKLAADRRSGDILMLLGDLQKSRVTAEQLEMTDVVKVLYRLLKTCSDATVRKTVKSLLSRWKRQYGSERRGDESKEPELPSGSSLAEAAGGGGVSSESQLCSVQTGEDKEGRGGTSSLLTHIPVAERGTSASSDSVRTKCLQLLLAALRPEPADENKAAHLAEDIERHVHELHRVNQLKYKSCVRSKVANLRNPRNPHLRQGLLSGSLPPEAFAQMSAEEMACPELRQLREEYSSRGVSERQLPGGVEGTRTQKIHCKRCEGSDCRVTQVSRGALFLPAWVRRGGPDDDSMTFVTCSGCGQQWYHSGWNCL